MCDVMIVQESERVVQAKSGAGGACSSADIKVSMPRTCSRSLTHAASFSCSSSSSCRLRTLVTGKRESGGAGRCVK